MVDATYRSDLRELNEHNFARFDAKLEQRIAELRAEFNSRFAELRAEMQLGFKNVDVKLEQLETRLTKRLFGFWIAQAATTVGLVFGVVKLLQREASFATPRKPGSNSSPAFLFGFTG